MALSTYALVVLLINTLCSAPDLVYTAQVRYDQHHVYRMRPMSVEQLSVLQSMDGQRSAYIFLDGVLYVGRSVTVVVAPTHIEEFLLNIQNANITHKLLDENAQIKLDAADEQVADFNRRDGVYNWNEYHELNDTYNWLQQLTTDYRAQVKLKSIGRSFEGRDIMSIGISQQASARAGAARKAIFLEAGMHAREWIGPATATYILQQLLSSNDSEVRWLAQNFDWYIVPHANPDGFVYTHTTDRLWRKTRTPYGNGCYGADPNRNWGFHWNEIGTSSKACSDTFAGPKAFSEVETKSLANYISSLKQQLFLYISLHSYSQLLLYPYGHTGQLPANVADLKRVYDAAIKGIRRRYGTRYRGGNIYDAIYPAAGASVDWAYGVAGVKFSYCYELRPASSNNWNGFRLPAKQILPTGEETLDSLKEMVKEAYKLTERKDRKLKPKLEVD